MKGLLLAVVLLAACGGESSEPDSPRYTLQQVRAIARDEGLICRESWTYVGEGIWECPQGLGVFDETTGVMSGRRLR